MKPQKKTTRLLSMIMSILMLLGMTPGVTCAVLAADNNDPSAPETIGNSTYTLIDGILSTLSISDINAVESSDDNKDDKDAYKVWVGDVRVTETNKNDILGDGTASFDPETNTLSLNKAVINKASTTSENGVSMAGCNIYSEQSLVVKGSATLSSAETGIGCAGNYTTTALTIDADLNINASKTGLLAFGPDLYINGGNIDFTGAEHSVGIMAYSNALHISGGNIKLGGDPMIGIYTFKEMDLSGCTIEAAGSEAAVLIDSADSIVDIASPLVITEPEGGLFQVFQMDNGRGSIVDCTGITDVSGNAAKSAKISPATENDVFRVSFDMQGHGYPVISQNVVSGNTVAKPIDPKADDYTFGGWFTETEYTNEYNFDTPVSSNFTLYAKWTGSETPEPEPEPEPGPDIVSGNSSAMDPVPEIIPGTTTEINLVKGQKFTIGKEWKTNDKSKVISINKKGVCTAKKEGETSISCGSGDDSHTIKVIVSKPSLNQKKLNLKINDANTPDNGQLTLTNTAQLPVIWYSSSPDVATVDNTGKVSAVSKGTSKITAYINGCAYTCSVSVKETKSAKTRTLHIAKGSSKTVSIKGLKKATWTASPEGLVSIKKNKFTGVEAGKTTISANGTDYSVDVFVEDLTLSDSKGLLKTDKGSYKYKLEINSGDSTQIMLDPSVNQDVIFRSNKADTAFVDESGNIYARSAGTCKLSTKIDGKTITVSVTVNESK